MPLKDWLERRSMADLDKWAKDNPSYEDASTPSTDNQYLFYINSKLAYANKTLDTIKILLSVIAGAVIAIGAKLFGWL